MRKIYYELDIGYSGCGDEGVMEVDDNATDHEIQSMVNNMARDHATSWEGDGRLGFDEDADSEDYEQQIEDFWAEVCGSWREATDEEIEEYQGR